MITPRWDKVIGGGEISVRLLVNELRDNGHHVDVLYGLNMIKMYYEVKKRVDDYDVFHSYNMGYMPVLGIITKKYNINSVATLNGIVYSNSMGNGNFLKKLRNNFFYKYINNIKKFVTLCEFHKKCWKKDGLTNIKIINNMIDKNFKVIPNKQADKYRVVMIGRESWYRDFGSFKTIANMYKDKFDFFTIGQKINGIKNIEFGSYDGMPELYSQFDILYHPQKVPILCHRVFLESMINGILVITTGNDLYSNIIQNNKSGILTENLRRDINIFKYLSEVQIVKLGLEGRKRVLDVCEPEKIVKQYIKVYEL